jgi:Protein of unknown function (DUF2442)
MADLTRADFEAAVARGDALMRSPRAERAHFDAGRNRIIVRLTTGVEIGLVPADIEGLQGASPADLKKVAVEASGLGIRFPTLDADLYVPALLEGVLGSKNWMARRASAVETGRRRPKVVAARKNGRKRGRSLNPHAA